MLRFLQGRVSGRGAADNGGPGLRRGDDCGNRGAYKPLTPCVVPAEAGAVGVWHFGSAERLDARLRGALDRSAPVQPARTDAGSYKLRHRRGADHPGKEMVWSSRATCAAFDATMSAVLLTFSGTSSRSLKSVEPIASPTQ